MSRKDDLRKLITGRQRRLQKLKEQQALQGLDTPPQIPIEIEDIENEIKQLQRELDLIKTDTTISNSVDMGSLTVAQIDDDIELLKALLRLIKPNNIQLTTPFSDIISSQYDRLKIALDKLERKKDWKTLIRTKEILREYFEYTGRYEDGVITGRSYYHALRELKNDVEAIWTRIKHVGYLLILAGKHSEGRKEIEEALIELSLLPDKNSETCLECSFYGHRYLGISFHRDNVKVDLDKAMEHYLVAKRLVDRFNDERKRNELHARVQGNFGNLAMSQKKHAEALSLFKESLGLFLELRDKEHIGIAKLQIVEALNYLQDKELEYKNVGLYLEEANLLFNEIRWLEGQARVYKYYTIYYRQQLRKASTILEKTDFIYRALRYAKLSKALYEQINNKTEVGKMEGQVENLSDELMELNSLAI